MEYIISPSILSADFNHLGRDVKAVENSRAKWLHIDVMDGTYVPNISFGFPVIESIRKQTNLFFDVHLMIVHPEKYIQRFAEAGADLITVHAEACTHLDRTIQEIRQAKAIVADRSQIISDAKREAETIIRLSNMSRLHLMRTKKRAPTMKSMLHLCIR